MYDISNLKSFENVRKWIRTINETCDAKVPILLVANKSDLRNETPKASQNKLIKHEYGELVARVIYNFEINLNLFYLLIFLKIIKRTMEHYLLNQASKMINTFMVH